MRVLVAGAGNVGVHVAGELAEDGHEVVVMEQTSSRVAELRTTGETPGVAWVVGDACEVTQLAKAEPQRCDVVVAVTGDDEDNLVISLLAKQEFGVPRVVARVNNPKNEWLFNDSWGVDISVSTPHLLAGMVEEAVSVGHLVRLLSFEHGMARLSEVTLAQDSPAIGQPLVGLGIPRDATVVAVIRQNKVVVPRGDTEFYEGDEVLLLVTGDADESVRRLFIAE
ncbi:MAG: Trk system potassium uptake protein TrkA [Acidimicrobiales bacterium]|nr:MAG: TrkA family potassium uptake protein [Actinomycetota bacterium]MBV6509367.1 Trk system potassium uptake protein TrkA [Acidimicrobiales bacterium]RIK04598.1 MAG: potassium transporter TrkA [Acidobacteriota bacterium]